MPARLTLPPPPLNLTGGTIAALKWLGVLFMTLDHVNRFLLQDAYPFFFAIGRLAFPLFAYVLGWNLARPGMLEGQSLRRLMMRLLIFGVIATIPYIALLGMAWWQLNILFTLLCGAATVYLVAHTRFTSLMLACFLFLAAGRYVDYHWIGIAFCVASWAYCRSPTWPAFLAWLTCLVGLTAINWHYATLLTLPLLVFASRTHVKLPRFQYFFYWYYPLHLTVIGLASKFAGA